MSWLLRVPVSTCLTLQVLSACALRLYFFLFLKKEVTGKSPHPPERAWIMCVGYLTCSMKKQVFSTTQVTSLGAYV
jgi:hypothetical protein